MLCNSVSYSKNLGFFFGVCVKFVFCFAFSMRTGYFELCSWVCAYGWACLSSWVSPCLQVGKRGGPSSAFWERKHETSAN